MCGYLCFGFLVLFILFCGLISHFVLRSPRILGQASYMRLGYRSVELRQYALLLEWSYSLKCRISERYNCAYLSLQTSKTTNGIDLTSVWKGESFY